MDRQELMTDFICRDCLQPFPETGLPHECPNCGGAFTLRNLTFTEPTSVPGKFQGIWRFAESFGLPASYPVSYLGEGETPLVPVKIRGREFLGKLENLNPSGSFKDRATAVLTSVLRGRNQLNVVEDSSGNAGGSLALYGAAFGIHCRISSPVAPADQNAGKLRFAAQKLSMLKVHARMPIKQLLRRFKGKGYLMPAMLLNHLEWQGSRRLLLRFSNHLGKCQR